MRLKSEKNLRLLRSCAQVKIIELTEKIAKLNEEQERLLDNDPDLKLFISGIYNDNRQNEGQPYNEQVTTEDLVKTDLSDFKTYNPDEELETAFKTYRYKNAQSHKFSKALDEYRTLTDKLCHYPINYNEIQDFMNNPKHTKSFAKFAKGVKCHTPIHLGYSYKKLADSIATRNKIDNEEYTTKSDRTFDLKNTTIKLNRDYTGRLKNHGIKLAFAAALSSVVILGYSLLNKDVHISQGDSTSHTSASIPDETTFETATSSTATPSTAEEEQSKIFTNSMSNMSTFKEACTDYFEKISDIYRYNTDKEIDLSGYGQSQIGYADSASIFLVELDGKTYTISGQGHSAPNYRYLQKALEATGAKVTATNSSLACIIDKNDPNRSIAITDSLGNPVRSGIVLTGSNNAYNADYVNQGRKILEEQGKTNCSEAECVGAYLLSDAHELDPELCRALGEVNTLTRYIKSTFFEVNGKDDTYAVQIFEQKSQNLAQSFEARTYSQQNQNQVQPNTQSKPIEHDER